MSASLVGSEMCIRDSEGTPRTTVRFAQRDTSPTGPPVKVPPRNLKGEAAVSYTHLTLPTICSV
eukprot:8546509-Alexandrium_andersonii.AAC.1